MSRSQKQPGDTRSRTPLVNRYLKGEALQEENSRLARRYLLTALESAILMPALFYLRFGEVSWFAIAFTVFMVVLFLLAALGIYLQERRSLHTEVRPGNKIADRIGAFWLAACAFGPFFGWLITALTLNVGNWRWIYLSRVFLAVILPVITAVPLVRYARGRAALIALPLLLIITALPMLSCWWVIADLHDGPKVTDVSFTREAFTGRLICNQRSLEYDLPCYAASKELSGSAARVTWLAHTGRVIEVKKI